MHEIRWIRDVVYAHVGDRELLLDLYLPQASLGPLPVIVWVHGGAWRAGSKDNPPAARMAHRGYAVASISYRLSQEAIFPAQIHDCKAAVRWLRANADQYDMDPGRIGAWGASAGGHLVALLGTTGGVDSLEGRHGNQKHSSRVQAVCNFFGPSDFLTMDDFPGAQVHNSPDSPESQLVGGPIQDNPEEVAKANPITYLSQDAPPFLIVHGDRDMVVPYHQGELLAAALQDAGVDVTLHPVEGAGHGFTEASPEQLSEIERTVNAFFDKHLGAARA